MNYTNNVDYLRKSDPIMNNLVKNIGPYKIKIRKNPFLALVESIINQQLTGKAGQSIYVKFLAWYENCGMNPSDIYSAPHNMMRSFGLSSMKIGYIKTLSRDLVNGKITLEKKFFFNMSDEETVEYLISIKGIGIWTAEMFMIFYLGRPDVFPLMDLGIKKSLQKWYFPDSKKYPTEQEMKNLSVKWKPFRSIASWYLWKSLQKFHSIG